MFLFNLLQLRTKRSSLRQHVVANVLLTVLGLLKHWRIYLKSLIHYQLDLDVSLKYIVLGYVGKKMMKEKEIEIEKEKVEEKEKEKEKEKEMGIEEDKKVPLLL